MGRRHRLSYPRFRDQIPRDRPFLCAIEDRRRGALLLVGTIYDLAT
jgi:serine protease inhibitor